MELLMFCESMYLQIDLHCEEFSCPRLKRGTPHEFVLSKVCRFPSSGLGLLTGI